MKLKFNYYSGWVGGWSDKTKLILISTLVEVVVEVEVELGNEMKLLFIKSPNTATLKHIPFQLRLCSNSPL